ncbi:SCO3242 family prenyltransferase [Microbacterium sp. SLBN-146]|uniref:SCO3242 family prenyltransferase n=1 Tax=Microbacterium sp. SLBN-146 TaxID=2768457 RepID=UPI00114E3A67|nr:UbiA family prenyltransferase [Microbacterium sp. SLBN-146]TQJ30795.1 4-hydroxybenzoate polyprenyltransferase [Microbacterium sp. SLBN-146]
MTRVGDLLDLVRAPAALTALGDPLVGAVSARGAVGGRAVPLAAASACLYAAGMALNDYSDADLDAVERPERPIPSGRVSRATALGLGAALTAAGVGFAFLAGRAAGVTALGLAASVWTYDLAAKASPAGPAVMAVCRGLNVVMGAAGPGWRGGLFPAGLMAAHTAAVTLMSRGEVNGTTVPVAAATATAMGATAVAVSFGAVPFGAATPAALLGAAGYAAAVLPAQIDAVRSPDAATARTATRAGIRGMVPLQLALAARAGSTAVTAALLAIGGLLGILGRARTKGDVT